MEKNPQNDLVYPGERVDDLQNGLYVIQNPEKFCFGMDAVLLSGFADIRQNEKVLDMGTGTGIIPFLLKAKDKGSHLTGLEIQEECADMARRSVSYNHLEADIDIVCGDIKEAAEIFGAASFHAVTSNPPYMIGQHGLQNPYMAKAIARHEILCTLEDVVSQTAAVLKDRGRFYMVHRPFRLAEIFQVLMKYKLEPKRMQLVYPYIDREPNMVLIEARKGGNSRITVERPLIVYEKPGVYTSDILRVLRTLKEVDLIAAEDTRNSIKLLNHFEIKTPMTSYHEYNKIEKAYTLIEKMQNGMNIALITDAGTPGISDPGEELAAMCYEAGIEVTSLPGPAACITALTLSGLPTRRFAFEAFLPMDKKERKEVLEELVNETRTIILYEAPHKLVRTLRDLRETLGNRRMTLCRELTKKHETAFHSTIDDLLAYYEKEKPLGECVLVIEGKSRQELKEEAAASWEEISIEEHMEIYEKKGMSRKDAMKQVAKDRGVSKRDIYSYLMK